MKTRLLILYASCFLLLKCASVQPPPGGPRDETDPELLSTIPIDGSKNFKGNSVQFIFDEDVQLDNIYKQLLITPITEDLKYESRVKRNRVILNFESEFADSTTYTINLRDAVVDVTEKNVAKNVKIAFSTGNFIDSMSVSGNVADLYSGLPPEEAIVMLFRPEDTINVQEPYYLSKTDEEGNYIIENIKVADYQIFALEENDDNYKYTKDEEEKIGFLTDLIQLDSIIKNLNFKVASYDNVELEYRRATSRNQYVELNFTKPLKDIYLTFEDSTYQDSIFYAIEEDVVRLYSIKSFEEDTEEENQQNQQKDKKKNRRKRKKKKTEEAQDIENTFSEPDSIVAYVRAIDFLENEVLDTAKFIFQRKRITEPEDLTLEVSPKPNEKKIAKEVFDIEIDFSKPITQVNKKGLYILNKRDTTLYRLDTLYALVNTDTIQITADSTLLIKNNADKNIEWQDTVKLVVDDQYIIDYQKVSSTIQRQLLVDKSTSIVKKAIKLKDKNNDNYKFALQAFDSSELELDTVYYDEEVTDTLTFNLKLESNHLLTKFIIEDYEFNPKQQIYIDSTAFISVEDDSVENTVIMYEAKLEEDYGTLGGRVALSDTVSYFLQVLDNKYNMEQEKYNVSSFEFNYVEPGSKYLRLQIDNNKNGIWEKGSFKLRIPAEEVYFRKEGPLDLRPNWEILDISLSPEDLSTYQQNKQEN